MHRIRLLALSLAVFAWTAALPAPAAASTIAVTTTDDELNADGDCSLREAVRAANTNVAVDACAAGQDDQTDTITLPAGTYTLKIAGDDNDASAGDLDLRDNTAVDDLVISGAGAATTIVQACAVDQQTADCPSGQGIADRVFHVFDARVAMSGLTVRHGRAQPLGGNRTGSGIYVQRLSQPPPGLTLTDVVVTKNGIASDADYLGIGGGIANIGGTLALTRVTVSDNVLDDGFGGGGLYNAGATATLAMIDSTVSGNASGGPIGSVGVRGGQGGGIFNTQQADATLTNCTISGNESGSSGGGITNAFNATMTLTNCTISGNSARGTYGGGIFQAGGLMNLRSSTVTLNRLGNGQGGGGINAEGSYLMLRNSIVAGNIHDIGPAAPAYSPDCDDDGGQRIESEGYTIVGNANQCTGLVSGVNGDQIGTTAAPIDAKLGPLADNGGLTLTHALLASSPAIDAGSPATPGSGGVACPATDQRGETRPAGIACDVGAVEGGGAPAGIGVDAVKPARGGNGGTVQIHVYGSGFVAGAAVKLVRPGFSDVVGTLTNVLGTVVTTSLDLHGVAAGTWSVVATNPDASSATLADAFTVETGGSADLWSTIVLPRAFLAGRSQSIFLVFGNRGTIDAYGVPLYLSFPNELEFHIPFAVSPPPAQAGQVATDWTHVAIDTTVPPPENRNAFPFLLPVVPAGSTGALKVRVKNPPGSEFCQGDECVAPGRLPFHVTWDIGAPYYQPDLSADVVAAYVARAKEFATPDEGTATGPSDAAIEAYVRTQLANVVAEGRAAAAVAGNQPVYSQAQLLVDTAQFIIDGSTTAFVPPSLRRWLASVVGGFGARTARANYIDPDCAPGDVFCDHNPTDGPPPCPFPKYSRFCRTDPPIIKCDQSHLINDEFVFVPCKPKDDDGDLVTSLDPNDKVGPGGPGSFIDGVTPLPYAVMFENRADATSDALEVTVTDQLDTAKYDLASFSLGSITFGSTFVAVPPGLAHFSTEVDLRPTRNILVGIDAALDAGTGLITWKFTTLDPATHQFPENPDQGFLPPDVTSPEGQATVLYTVNPKQGLGVGATVCNHAHIVFDLNAPIDTPEFCNTVGTPAQPEIDCGNCIDDDGDGLTDFEDPDCCTGSGPSVSLQHGMIKPVKSASRLLLQGALSGTVPDATATGLAVQLRPANGSEVLCARIAPEKFRRKGKVVRFSDKKGKLDGAGGLASVLLKTRKGGSVALALAAKKATFATPSAGPSTITFGFGDGSTAGQCAAVTPTFRAKKGGVLVAP